MLKAIDISHSFDYPLFKNLSFTLSPKESMAVVGVSGSGKSSLLHILATFLKPKDGVVKLFDKDLYSLSSQDILKIRRDDVGIIFQSHYLLRGFLAIENLKISSLLAKEEIDLELMEKFNIKNILNQQVGSLSGGQQQRVSIARVLTKKPKIIFADEPTGNLDSENSKIVMDNIFDYIEKNSAILFLVTHDEKLAKRCNKSYKLENCELKEC